MAATKQGLPLFSLEGGQRGSTLSAGADIPGALIDRMADTIFTRRLTAHYALYREGIGSERVQCLGGLATNVMHEMVAQAPSAHEVLNRLGVRPVSTSVGASFGLMTISATPDGTLSIDPMALIDRLGSLPSPVWLVDEVTHSVIQAQGLSSRLQRQRVVVVPALGIVEIAALMSDAGYLVTDERGLLRDEAEAMGLHCVQLGTGSSEAARQPMSGGPVVATTVEQAVRAVHDALEQRTRDREAPQFWDGGPARSMAKLVARRISRR